jgi:Ca-activated chloride channel family protein
MIADEFFFLRPLWLLLIIPLVIALSILLRRRRSGDSGAWNQLVDAHLLKHLTVQQTGVANSPWLLAALGAGLLAAVVAMAGPTWQKNDMPSFKPRDPAVIVMSMAQSMNADDVSPNRLTRAGHKLRDILGRSKGGDLGFIIYADRPFVATPLTSDIRVIEEMLPELSPNLMPVLGNRLDSAIGAAGDLLERAGAPRGKIIVIADDSGNQPEKSLAAASEVASMGYTVNVLGVGTLDGGKLQTASGQIIRGSDNQPLITRLDEAGLTRLAQAGAGYYARLSPDNTDLDKLFPQVDSAVAAADRLGDDLQVDAWNDMGYWLLIIPVLLAPLAFRRGMLMLIPLSFALLSLPQSQTAEAGWTDMWQTPDQQAASVFSEGDYSVAAKTFENPEWKASALYKSGQYDQAAGLFAAADETNRDFNRGNSLAHMGEFEKAIEAYDQALEVDPDDADAKFNRDLVARLLEQQKQQEQQQQDQQQQQSGKNDQDQQQSEQNQQDGQGQQQQQQSGQGGQNQDDQQQSAQNQQGGEQDQQQSAQNQQGGGNPDSGKDQQGAAGDDSAQPGEQQQAGEQDRDQSGKQDQASARQTEGSEQPQSGEDQAEAERASGKEQDSSSRQSSAQAAGEPSPEQTAQQDKSAANGSEPQQQDGEQGEQPNSASSSANSDDSDDRSAFRKAMDALLQGNGEADPGEQPQQQAEAASANAGISETEQAHEQQLRAVPDDSSGLLKARIRQHYQRLRGAQQNG